MIKGNATVKRGHAEMLKNGVIMDVVNPEQAKIAQEAGACAVMALERVPADIRRDGGVARMSDPQMIKGIKEAVTIPVMAKARIGHFVEAQILEALEIDYVDESEVSSRINLIIHFFFSLSLSPFSRSDIHPCQMKQDSKVRISFRLPFITLH
mmetsp:Transcript_45164/g.51887  ORF Transcript_45164/g.51887 Transcript_45164/m.51887 type:complete len:153 (+) Transcript_45164:175-633(+)